MSINEEDLPGIGRRYEIIASRGQRLVLIIHHSGRRDLYVMDRHREDPTCVVELTDDQARRIGAILGGAFFKPAVVEEIERVVGEFVVDWVTVGEDAAAVGQSIQELQLRRRSGMSVVAIVRGKKTITGPDPNEVLVAGDRLVVVGRREDIPRFLELVLG
ncbi:MAG: cation:proton antiporter regulatory subunit [Actinomycetota bacterium]